MAATVPGVVVLLPHSTTNSKPVVFNPFLTGTGLFSVRQLTKCKEASFSGKGGGALGTRMNLFDRFSRVVKSYANAVISSFEDPEKILEQSVLEMNDDLIKMRQATAQEAFLGNNYQPNSLFWTWVGTDSLCRVLEISEKPRDI